MPVKIAICDDEHNMRENLKNMIEKQNEDCLLDLFCSGEDLLKSPDKYDIYFLDIQMTGMDGMETAKKLRENTESVIIFVTAFTDYMPNAFDVKAFHYLTKPVDENKLINVFTRAIQEHKRKNNDRHLVVKSGGDYHRIPVKEIFYVESQGRKMLIHSKSGVVEYYEKAKTLEETLGDSFFRCHRCYIVNMEHIVRYNSATVCMTNGDEVFVAQKKYSDFVKNYLKFLTPSSNA